MVRLNSTIFCVFMLFVASLNASVDLVDTKIKKLSFENYESKKENLLEYLKTLTNKYHHNYANEIKLTRKKESKIDLFLSKLNKAFRNVGRKQQWDTQYGK